MCALLATSMRVWLIQQEHVRIVVEQASSATFCWFPRRAANRVGCVFGFDAELRNPAPGRFELASMVEKAKAAGRQLRKRQIVRYRQGCCEPSPLRSSESRPTPCSRRSLGVRGPSHVLTRILPDRTGSSPKMALTSSVRPRPPAKDARTSHGRARGWRVWVWSSRELIELEHHVARLAARVHEELNRCAAGHEANHLGRVGFADDTRAHRGSVTKHREPIGDSSHFSKKCDVQDSDAIVRKTPHHIEQPGRILATEAAGRLIQDEHATALLPTKARAISTSCWFGRLSLLIGVSCSSHRSAACPASGARDASTSGAFDDGRAIRARYLLPEHDVVEHER